MGANVVVLGALILGPLEILIQNSDRFSLLFFFLNISQNISQY